jgi:hypothetical protein
MPPRAQSGVKAESTDSLSLASGSDLPSRRITASVEPPTISFKEEDDTQSFIKKEDNTQSFIKKEELDEVEPLATAWHWMQQKVSSRLWLVATQDGKNFLVKHGREGAEEYSCTLDVPDKVTKRSQITSLLPAADDQAFWPSHTFNNTARWQTTYRGKVTDMVLALRSDFGL